MPVFRISLADRHVPGYFQSLEHLLRYCARPAFSLQRLSVVSSTGDRPQRVHYTLPRHNRGNRVGPGRKQKSAQPGASGVIQLRPFEFLDRLGALIPSPQRHWHRYQGVFAPNHPLRQAVTAFAIGNIRKQRNVKTGEHDGVLVAAGGDCCGPAGVSDENPYHRDKSRFAWAKLLARLDEEFPLGCSSCGGDIRLISFIIDKGRIRKILTHLGEPLEPSHACAHSTPPRTVSVPSRVALPRGSLRAVLHRSAHASHRRSPARSRTCPVPVACTRARSRRHPTRAP